ncbi:MAG: ATP-binding cassette domain-containing protein [Alkaliphilus sp.]
MVIEIKGLSKSYKDLLAVNKVNLNIKKGEIFGMLGSNGVGKTTTIECTTAIREFDEGSVKILDIDIKKYN